MKIDIEELAKNLPKAIEAGGGASPEWLTKTENIVKGINDMIAFYNKLQKGNNPAAQKEITEAPMSFSEARSLKKAEMAGKVEVMQPVANNEFKEILEGLVKATTTLEGMGYAKKSIGEVIVALPFTLTQVKDFLEKLYKSKYGVSNG